MVTDLPALLVVQINDSGTEARQIFRPVLDTTFSLLFLHSI